MYYYQILKLNLILLLTLFHVYICPSYFSLEACVCEWVLTFTILTQTIGLACTFPVAYNFLHLFFVLLSNLNSVFSLFIFVLFGAGNFESAFTDLI